MMNVSLEYETDWIVKGTITTDLDFIDLKNENFRIEIMDLLEHYIRRTDASAVSATYEKDNIPLLSISNKEYLQPTTVSGYVAGVTNGSSTNFLKDYDLVLSSWADSPKTTIPNDAYVFSNSGIADTILSRIGTTGERTFSAIQLPSTETCETVNTVIYESNVSDFNNSDTIHLIRNGFQFWISGKNLMFRMTVRGESSLNSDGYYDKLTGEWSGKVGFSLAYCIISLDATHKINFKVPIAPKFKTSEIFRAELEDDIQVPTKPYKTCPICTSGYLIEPSTQAPVPCPACNGQSVYYQDRCGYPYNNSLVTQNMLFVNNNTNAYSANYSAVWNKHKEEYVLSSNTNSSTYQTPIYQVITSAIIPKYLMEETTVDLLTGETANRNMFIDFTSSSVSSVLMSDDKTDYCELPFETMPSTNTAYFTINDYNYVTATTGRLYGDINVKLIVQTISSDEPDIRDKTVLFKMDI